MTVSFAPLFFLVSEKSMQKDKKRLNKTELSDEQLVKAVQEGNSSALTVLTVRYMPIVISRAEGYFSDGYDKEDLAQEGMIGLLRAVRSYSSDRGASFHTFALLCIDRNIISAVRSSLSAKKIPSSSLLYIDEMQGDSVIADKASFEEELIAGDTVERIYRELESILSKTEFAVFKLYLKGNTYEAISSRLSLTKKAVDNAVCRARKKLKSLSF